MTTMLTERAMTGFKRHVTDTVAFALLRINGRLERFNIHNMRIVGDAVKIDVLIDSGRFPGEITLTEIQLFDISGELWLLRPVELSKTAFNQGIFCRISLTFIERMVDETYSGEEE